MTTTLKNFNNTWHASSRHCYVPLLRERVVSMLEMTFELSLDYGWQFITIDHSETYLRRPPTFVLPLLPCHESLARVISSSSWESVSNFSKPLRILFVMNHAHWHGEDMCVSLKEPLRTGTGFRYDKWCHFIHVRMSQGSMGTTVVALSQSRTISTRAIEFKVAGRQ